MNNFWDGFEKRAGESKDEPKKSYKKYILPALGLGAAALAGRKIYTSRFKLFKDAVPKMDMWYTQGKFHSGPKRDKSHWYDAIKKEKHNSRTGRETFSPESGESLDIAWASRGHKNHSHTEPFRYKGKWVTLEYNHLPHDPLLSDEINRRSPYVRSTVWDKKPSPEAVLKTRDAGFKKHVDLIKEEGQAMKDFEPNPTGAGT